MIGIIDYQVGNVGNVIRALRELKHETVVLEWPGRLSSDINVLILPGVGAFEPAMENISRSKWGPALKEWNNDNRGLIGICLGMQLLMEKSMEDGCNDGLGIMEGIIEPLHLRKYPHIGWNNVEWNSKNRSSGHFNEKIPNGKDFYFVHGYALRQSPNELSRTTVENMSFVSSVIKGKTIGFQFHPERSGRWGLELLKCAIEIVGGVQK